MDVKTRCGEGGARLEAETETDVRPEMRPAASASFADAERKKVSVCQKG